MWEYTWDELQDYISTLPIERIINIQPGQKPDEIKKKYIESFCDPLTHQENAAQLEKSYVAFEERLASIKAKGGAK